MHLMGLLCDGQQPVVVAGCGVESPVISANLFIYTVVGGEEVEGAEKHLYLINTSIEGTVGCGFYLSGHI